MKKNKGFTLVEIIVILIILAIMAAILIPSLTHYIDKAKEKQITSEARSALMATQTILSETYAKYGNVEINGDKISYKDYSTATPTTTEVTDETKAGGMSIYTLAELGDGTTHLGTVTATIEEGTCQIDSFRYQNAATGKIAIHNSDGTWKMS